jgi:hypothetical protein
MFLFRSVIFYPLAALVAAGLILISLGPQPWAPRAPASQSGAPGQDGAVVFGPSALAGIDAGAHHIVFSPRNASGAASTLHIAVKKGAPLTPTPTERGARLMLNSETANRFGGQPVRVDVLIRPAPIASAPEIAVSWQGSEPVTIWSQAETGTEEKTLSFTLPAATAPQAIGLYVINPSANEAFAVEIGEIHLSPAR